MGWWVNLMIAKPDGQSLFPETQMEEGENQLLQTVF